MTASLLIGPLFFSCSGNLFNYLYGVHTVDKQIKNVSIQWIIEQHYFLNFKVTGPKKARSVQNPNYDLF